MGDKGEGGVKNLKKWVTSFMDGPLLIMAYVYLLSCTMGPSINDVTHLGGRGALPKCDVTL